MDFFFSFYIRVSLYYYQNNNYEVDCMEKTRYVSTWRNKWITSGAGSIDDFIKTYEYLAKSLRNGRKWE